MNLNTEIILILHLLSLTLFLGGQLYYLFIAQPASFNFFSINEQIRYLQNVLRRQNPTLLLALCLIVVTGGFLITPLKGSLGADYFSAFGSKLINKLGLFFIVFFVTVYQSLALGFKIRFMDPTMNKSSLTKTLSNVRWQMTLTCIFNIILTSYVIYVARNL